ncbi:tetratricopeptide repeat protein [Anaerolineales bacterium HSG24]|nr:tetratricopeptide repeat protein [Anaerolineales bacterium HSG24]
MPNSDSLPQLAIQYQTLTETLHQAGDNLSAETVLETLLIRDQIAAQLVEEGVPRANLAQRISSGDQHLNEIGERVAALPSYAQWRTSLKPPETAWWWQFQPAKPSPTFTEQYDWLWTGLAITCLTISLSVVADITPRFLTGGSDAFSALAVMAQAVLTLLTTSSILTKTGQEAIRRMLNSVTIIPKRWWHELGLGASILFLVVMILFRFSLPTIALSYNDRGYDDYEQGQLTSAQYNYERALKLNPDLIVTHYNLALIYEDLNDLETAQAEYEIAMQGNLDTAYNNLARLYILQGQPDKAPPLLWQQLKKPNFNQLERSVQYNIHKNLGWARLEQGRHDEATTALNDALILEPNQAPAHCLMAQLLMAQEAETAQIETHWEACLQDADPTYPDEDMWMGLAREFYGE